MRIRRGAIADALPQRDLLLSPDHALFLDGVLIPVKHLVNGRTIRQESISKIEYWHVELDAHAVIFTEGLAAESYLDTGNRSAFANGGGCTALHPQFAPRSWEDACAELVEAGPRLVAARRRLFARAGMVPQQVTPDLLVLADERALPADILPTGRWRFAIPPGVRSLRLVSTGWTPALLGVAVDGRKLRLDDDALFSGFHAVEMTSQGKSRWTDGDARLVVPPRAAEIILWVGDRAQPTDKARKQALLF